MSNPLILGTNSIKDTGYEVANSLRFNKGSSDNLSRSTGTPSNRKKFTLSFWCKISGASANLDPFGIHVDGNTALWLEVPNNGTKRFKFVDYRSSAENAKLETNRVFRDVSAWFSVILICDSTLSTSSDRLKLYINGVRETSFASSIYPSQNYDFTNNVGTTVIGKNYDTNYFDGYLAEFVYCDGQALAHTDFGEFDEDSGIWKPIDVSGLTFGNEGFYLDFENSGSLGADVSGNGNNFTVNNLTSIDQSTDTCTNNFAKLNPLAIPTSGGANTFSNGNLEITNSADAFRTSFSTIGVSSGKWYWEAKFLSGEMKQYIGISKPQDTMDYLGQSANSYSYQGENGRKNNNGSHTAGYGSSASTGDIIMVAFDADNGAIWVGKNGTWFSSATQAEIEAGTTTNAMYSSITIDDFFVVGATVEDSNIQFNFGSPMYSISSGNSDGNGYGNFEYSVPSGYYSLCTKNLAEYG